MSRHGRVQVLQVFDRRVQRGVVGGRTWASERGRIDLNANDDNGLYAVECAVDGFDLDTFELLYSRTERSLYYTTVAESERYGEEAFDAGRDMDGE